jgi:hypothetical protein
MFLGEGPEGRVLSVPYSTAPCKWKLWQKKIKKFKCKGGWTVLVCLKRKMVVPHTISKSGCGTWCSKPKVKKVEQCGFELWIWKQKCRCGTWRLQFWRINSVGLFFCMKNVDTVIETKMMLHCSQKKLRRLSSVGFKIKMCSKQKSCCGTCTLSFTKMFG